MKNVLYETEIECSEKLINPFFGNNRAKLIIYHDKLIFKKINTKLEIPKEILISNISSIKLKFTWKLQLRLEIFYKEKSKIKRISFVTGNVTDKIMYVSTPFRTYKVYKIIKTLKK